MALTFFSVHSTKTDTTRRATTQEHEKIRRVTGGVDLHEAPPHMGEGKETDRETDTMTP